MSIWLFSIFVNLFLMYFFQIRLPLYFGLGTLIFGLIAWACFSGIYKRFSLWIILLSLVFVWYSFIFAYRFSWQLPKKFINKNVLIFGEIASIPKKLWQGEQFQFRLQRFNHCPSNILIRLNWYHKYPKLRMGDRWRLWVRLKPLHGLHNFGGFNYQLLLLSRGIQATGYVNTKKQNQLIESNFWHHPIGRIRQHINTLIQHSIRNKLLAAIIAAVTVGSRTSMTSQQWQVFQNTGTSHLMAISGLHIGMIASLVYFFWVRIWSLWSKLLIWVPAQIIGSVAAIGGTLIYALLSGFSLPTQRAAIMIMALLFAKLFYRAMPIYQRIQLAFILILLLQPLAIYSASFWLSFAAVFWINYGMRSVQSKKKSIKQWFRLQWVLFIGLLPLSLYFFQQTSLMMFMANLIAVPWIGMVVVPLSLIACCFSGINTAFAQTLFYWSAKLLWPLWCYLQWLAKPSWAVWIHAIPSQWALLAGIIAVFISLAPKGFPGRLLACAWMLPLFYLRTAAPERQAIWLTVLDVGQGLAVLVRTAHHALLYDAGPAFRSGFDAGKSVVVPYLRYRGLTRLDRFVISHGDNDHIGGAASVLKAMNVISLLTSVPNRFSPGRTQSCHAGQHWLWDGVRFQMLSPKKNVPYEGNNSSCVLRVSNGRQALLLTGDIEQPTEEFLLSHSRQQIASLVLVAPHHGSKTSSSINFVRAIYPRYVIFSTGYYNRYHFPSRQVMARFRKIGSNLYNTARMGAIFIRLFANGQVRLTTTNQIN